MAKLSKKDETQKDLGQRFADAINKGGFEEHNPLKPFTHIKVRPLPERLRKFPRWSFPDLFPILERVGRELRDFYRVFNLLLWYTAAVLGLLWLMGSWPD